MTRRRVIWLGVLFVIVVAALAACGGAAATQSSQVGGLSEATIRAQQQNVTPLIPTQANVTQPAGMFGLPTRPPAEEATAEATDEATPEPTDETTSEPTDKPTVSAEAVTFEASGDAAEAIDVAYAQARALVPDQTFEVTFTDDQLTAAVNARLAESDSGQMIQDPVITFVPDEIDLAFTAGLGASGLGFEVAMAMSAGVDENGDVQVEVLSAEAGGAELQSDQMDILNDVMTKALVGAAAADVSDEVDLTITDIVIGEGTATVSGYVTPQG